MSKKRLISPTGNADNTTTPNGDSGITLVDPRKGLIDASGNVIGRTKEQARNQAALQSNIFNLTNPSVESVGLNFDLDRGFRDPGFSKFDKGVVPSRLDEIENYRSQQQGALGKWGAALTRFLPGTAMKVIEGLGYVSGAVDSGISELLNPDEDNFSKVYDNAIANTMAELGEEWNKTIPIHVSNQYREGNLLQKMGTAEFYANDLMDGAQFLMSAAIPGLAFSKAAKGLGLAAKATSKIGKGVGTIASKAGLAYNPNALFTVAGSAIYNTAMEAGFEANEMNNVMRQTLQGQINPDTGLEYTSAEIRQKAAEAAADVYKGNSIVLLVPNLIQSLMFHGGNGIIKGIERAAKKGITPSFGKAIAKQAGTGFVSEGLEEGSQEALKNVELRQLTEDNYAVPLFLEEMVNNFTTTEGQHAMILGGILGMFMGGGKGFSDTRTQNKAIKNNKDIVLNDYNRITENTELLKKVNTDIANGKATVEDAIAVEDNIFRIATATSIVDKSGIIQAQALRPEFESVNRGLGDVLVNTYQEIEQMDPQAAFEAGYLAHEPSEEDIKLAAKGQLNYQKRAKRALQDIQVYNELYQKNQDVVIDPEYKTAGVQNELFNKDGLKYVFEKNLDERTQETSELENKYKQDLPKYVTKTGMFDLKVAEITRDAVEANIKELETTYKNIPEAKDIKEDMIAQKQELDNQIVALEEQIDTTSEQYKTTRTKIDSLVGKDLVHLINAREANRRDAEIAREQYSKAKSEKGQAEIFKYKQKLTTKENEANVNRTAAREHDKSRVEAKQEADQKNAASNIKDVFNKANDSIKEKIEARKAKRAADKAERAKQAEVKQTEAVPPPTVEDTPPVTDTRQEDIPTPESTSNETFLAKQSDKYIQKGFSKKDSQAKAAIDLANKNIVNDTNREFNLVIGGVERPLSPTKVDRKLTTKEQGIALTRIADIVNNAGLPDPSTNYDADSFERVREYLEDILTFEEYRKFFPVLTAAYALSSISNLALASSYINKRLGDNNEIIDDTEVTEIIEGKELYYAERNVSTNPQEFDYNTIEGRQSDSNKAWMGGTNIAYVSGDIGQTIKTVVDASGKETQIVSNFYKETPVVAHINETSEIDVGHNITLRVVEEYDGDVKRVSTGTDEGSSKSRITEHLIYKDSKLTIDGREVKNKEEFQNRIPIEILSDTKQRLGFLHDTEWLKDAGVNVVEEHGNPAVQMNTNVAIRKYVIANGEVPSIIEDKGNGYLNIRVEKLEGGNPAISDPTALPNIQEAAGTDNVVLVLRGGVFYDTIGTSGVQVDVETDSFSEGSVAIRIPTSNGKIIPAFAYSPNLREANLVETVVELIRTFAEQDQANFKRMSELGMPIESNEGYINLMSRFLYIKSFQDSLTNSLETGVSVEDVFFDITKDGTIKIATGDKKVREFKKGGKISDKDMIFLREALNRNNAFVNVDIRYIGNNSEVSMPLLKGEEFIVSHEDYTDFLLDNLRTPIVEKSYTTSAGKTHYVYTNNATVEIQDPEVFAKYNKSDKDKANVLEKEQKGSVNIPSEKKVDVTTEIEDDFDDFDDMDVFEADSNTGKINAAISGREISDTAVIEKEQEARNIRLTEAAKKYIVEGMSLDEQEDVTRFLVFAMRDLVMESDYTHISLKTIKVMVKADIVGMLNKLNKYANPAKFEKHKNTDFLDKSLKANKISKKAYDSLTNLLARYNTHADLLAETRRYSLVNDNMNVLLDFSTTRLEQLGFGVADKKFVSTEELQDQELNFKNQEKNEVLAGIDNLVKGNWDDGFVFQRDSKDTAGAKIKLLLATLSEVTFVRDGAAKVQEGDYNGTPKYKVKKIKNYLGEERIVNFDSVYRELHKTLHDVKWDFDTMLDIMYKNAKPYMTGLANELINMDEQVKNQFVQDMAKEYSRFMTLLWRTQSITAKVKGKQIVDHVDYSLIPIDSNRYSQESELKLDWLENQVYESSIFISDINGELFIDNKKVKEFDPTWKEIQTNEIDINKLYRQLHTQTTAVVNKERNRGGQKLKAEDVTLRELEKTKKAIQKREQGFKDGTLVGIDTFLNNIGIKLSQAAIEEIRLNPSFAFSRSLPRKQFISTDTLFKKGNYGAFYNLYEALKGSETTEVDEKATSLDLGKLAENNPLIGAPTSVSMIAAVEANYREDLGSNSHVRADNKTVYDFTMFKHLSATMLRLKSDPTYLKNIMSAPYAKNSTLGKRFLSGDTKAIQNTTIWYDEAIKKKSSSKPGVMKGKRSKAELEKYALGLFFNKGRTSKEDDYANFANITHADKGTSSILKAPKFKITTAPIDSAIVFGEEENARVYEVPVALENDGLEALTEIAISEIERTNDFIVQKYGFDPATGKYPTNWKDNVEKFRDVVDKKYFKGGHFNYFFPELNDKMETIRTPEDSKGDTFRGYYYLGDTNRRVVKAVVAEHFLRMVQETHERWSGDLDILYTTPAITDERKIKNEEGEIVTVVSVLKEEKLNFKFIDKDYLELTRNRTGYPDTNEGNNQLVYHIIMDLELNSMLANMNYTQLFGGDPAQSNKSRAKDTRSMVLQVVSEYNKRSSKDIGPGTQGSYKWNTDRKPVQGDNKEYVLHGDRNGKLLGEENYENYLQIFINDIETERYKEEYKKSLNVIGYSGIEGADAQEFITLKERLVRLMNDGKITDSFYVNLMSRIKENENKNRSIAQTMKDFGVIDFSRLSDVVLTEEELTTVFGAEKPLYAAQVYDSDLNYNKVIYIKSSAYPLMPGMTVGLEIDNLRKAMEMLETLEDTTVRAAMGTATKQGATKMNSIFKIGKNKIAAVNNDGLSKLVIEGRYTKLHRDGLRIQQEIPYDSKKQEVTTVSQMNKLIFEGILAPTMDKTYKDFAVPGSKKLRTAKEMRDLKEAARIELFNIAKKELFDRLKINDKGEFTSLEALQKILIEEAKDRGYPLNDIESLELTEDKKGFIMPLYFNNSLTKFEGILQSMVSKIVLQKMKGKSFVQASSYGFVGDIKSKDKSSIIMAPGHTLEEGLKFVEVAKDDKGTSVSYAQVLIPFKYWDNDGNLLKLEKFTTEVDGKLILDTSKMDNDLLKIVGARIPNQGHNSMLTIKIVGFLPKSMGDVVVVPEEITKQMGADFDVDKLFTYMFNTELKDDKLTKVGYDADKAMAGQSKAALQNLYIDLHLSILSNEEVVKKMLQPLDLPDIETEATTLYAIDNANAESKLFSPFSRNYQQEAYLSNRAGKAGVAIQSNASTFMSVIQDKGLYLSKDGSKEVDVIKVDGKDFTSLGLGWYTNSKEIRRSNFDIIAMIQNAAVDNAKDQLLDKLNLNSNTFNAANAMAMLTTNPDKGAESLSLEFITRVLKQKSIMEFVRKSETLNDTTLENFEKDKLNKMIEGLLVEYQSKADPNFITNAYTVTDDKVVKNTALIYSKIPSAKNLLALLKTSEENKDMNYYNAQVATLEFFVEMSGLGENIAAVQRSLSADSKGVGKDINTALVKEQQFYSSIINNRKIGNIESIVGEIRGFNTIGEVNLKEWTVVEVNKNGNVRALKFNTELGKVIENSIILANDLWTESEANRPILPHNTIVFNDVIETLEGLRGSEIQKLTTDELASVYKEVKSYIYSTKQYRNRNTDQLIDNPLFGGKSLAELRNELMLGDNTLGTRIQEAKKTSWGKDNMLINSLLKPEHKPYKDGTEVTFVNFNGVRGDRLDDQRVTQAFYSLLNGTEEAQAIADDLIRYAYVTGGVQNPNTYLRYIPAPYLIDIGLGDMLSNITWENIDINSDHFVMQYLQHNPALALNATEEQVVYGKDKSQFRLTPPDLSRSYELYDRPIVQGRELPKPPKYLKIYDNDKAGFRLYRNLESDVNTNYIELSTLGGARGFREYDMDTGFQTSLLVEKNPLKPANNQLAIDNIKREHTERRIRNTLSSNNTYRDHFGETKAEYNREDIINAIDTIATSNSKHSELASIILAHSDKLPGTLTATREQTAGARGSQKADVIDINVTAFRTKPGDKDSKAFTEEFREVLLHELLHPIIKDAVDRRKAGETGKELFFLVDKLESLRLEVIEGLEGADREGYDRVSEYTDEIQRKLNRISSIVDAQNEAVSNGNFDRSNELGVEAQAERDTMPEKLTWDDVMKYYPLVNIDEFSVGAVTNEDFQRYLNDLPYKGKKSVLARIAEIVERFFKELASKLGVPVKKGSILKESVETVLALITIPTVVENTKQVLDISISQTNTQVNEFKPLSIVDPISYIFNFSNIDERLKGLDGKAIYSLSSGLVTALNTFDEIALLEEAGSEDNQLTDHGFLNRIAQIDKGDFSPIAKNNPIKFTHTEDIILVEYDVDNHLRKTNIISDIEHTNHIFDALEALYNLTGDIKVKVPELNINDSLKKVLNKKDKLTTKQRIENYLDRKINKATKEIKEIVDTADDIEEFEYEVRNLQNSRSGYEKVKERLNISTTSTSLSLGISAETILANLANVSNEDVQDRIKKCK